MTGETLAPTFGQLGNMTTTFIGIGGILTIVVLYFIVTYNSIIRTKNSVDNAFSAIDTVLQNRYDLIPNLVAVVKQYAAHESGVISQVTELRSKLMSNPGNSGKERFQEENMLQAGMKSLFAVAENYPDLKASNNFLELQSAWSEIEDRLQGARRAYNSAVKAIRDKQQMFPSNIVANMMKIEPYTMFEANETVRNTAMDAKALFNN